MTQEVPDIHLYATGTQLIPTVTTIKILALQVQANGHNIHTIRTLEKSVAQTSRLIARVANRHHERKEATFVRLVQAFV